MVIAGQLRYTCGVDRHMARLESSVADRGRRLARQARILQHNRRVDTCVSHAAFQLRTWR